MKVGELLTDTIARFKGFGIESARLDCLLLLETVTNQERSFLLAHEDYKLNKNQLERFDKLVAKRSTRLPIAYVLGQKEFYGYDFFVSRNTLIPRVETENMVEYIISSLTSGASVLDVGTGCGAIAICLKLQRPDLVVSACDISEAALAVAKKNARAHGADINFIQSDLLATISGKFDAIAANLPYVPDGRTLEPELKYEPEQALFGGKYGLDLYGKLFEETHQHLKTGGTLVIEHEPAQSKSLKMLATKSGFELSTVSKYISKLT